LVTLVKERAAELWAKLDDTSEDSLGALEGALRSFHPNSLYRWMIPPHEVDTKREKFISLCLRSTNWRQLYRFVSDDAGDRRFLDLSDERLTDLAGEARQHLADLALQHLGAVEHSNVELDYDLITITMHSSDEILAKSLVRWWYKLWTKENWPNGEEPVTHFSELDTNNWRNPWVHSAVVANWFVDRLLNEKPNGWYNLANKLTKQCKLERESEVSTHYDKVQNAEHKRSLQEATTTSDCLGSIWGKADEQTLNKALELARSWQDYWLIYQHAEGRHEYKKNAQRLFFQELAGEENFDTALVLASDCPWKEECCIHKKLFKACLKLADNTSQVLELLDFSQIHGDWYQRKLNDKLSSLSN